MLQKQQQVQVLVIFKGREVSHSELGINVLTKIDAGVSTLGKCTINPLKGSQILMSIQPYKL